MSASQVATADLEAVAEQLGRPPRGVRRIAARCPAGHPAVVETEPRLPDGTPFPTLYYVTCPRLTGAIGTLEGSGLMREMSDRLSAEPDVAAQYADAHERYLSRREAVAHVPEISQVTAGGMPTRVKCLHVLVGQSLAEGPGVNPFGDEALRLLESRSLWPAGPCSAGDAP